MRGASKAAAALGWVTLVACGASPGGGMHGPAFDAAGGAASDDAAVVDAAAGIADAAAGDATTAPAPGPWEQQLVYLTLPDRFGDGDPGNDGAGQPGCLDPADPSLFHGGDLAGLRQRIPYLHDLGVGAVWATPLYAQVPLRNGACGYHGYWADDVDPDDGALEPKLGTRADVAALTGALHAAGMRFVLDMVVNHPGRGARIVAQHPDWFHDPATCAQLGDPNVYCPLNGLPDFAQEKPAVAAYLTAMSRGWVQRVMPDGIRMDTARNVPPAYFAQSFVPGVRAVRSDLFLVAEYFDAGNVADFLPVLDAGFDSAFHFPLQHALDDAFAKRGSLDEVATAVAATFSALGEARALRLATMLDNHDLPRIMSDAPAGMPPGEMACRYEVALAALFTLPGIPQLYQGDELGMLGTYPDNRRDMPAWAWSAATRAGAHAGYVGDGQATFALAASLARLRAGEVALWKGHYREAWRPNGGANVLAFERVAPAPSTSRVLVVLSDDAAAQTLSLPLGAPSPWADGETLKDALGLGAPATVTVAGGRVQLTVPPLTAAVYREGT